MFQECFNSAHLLLTQIAPNLHIDEGFLFVTECTYFLHTAKNISWCPSITANINVLTSKSFRQITLTNPGRVFVNYSIFGHSEVAGTNCKRLKHHTV